MQEITFLSLRKSKIFWGSMPPDLPSSQKCLGQSKILVTRLTVPVTFASAEGRFSKLKLLKTVMRSVMNQERFGELLTLACERDLKALSHYIAYRTSVCQRMKNITHTPVYADIR